MHEYLICNKLHRCEKLLFAIAVHSLVLFLSLLTAPTSHALQVTLGWDPGVEPNLAGYKIHCGTSTRNYSVRYDAGKVYSYTVSNLQAGATYYFAATAYDRYGMESDFSKEVIYVAPASNNPPEANSSTLYVIRGMPRSGVLVATDPDGDALTYEIASQGTKGRVVVTNGSTGAYTYSPNRGASGGDSFTFRVRDPKGLTATATVAVTIISLGNNASVARNGALDSGILVANDAPSNASVKIVLEAENGSLSAPMALAKDTEASGGTYIWIPDGKGAVTDPLNPRGQAVYSFSVPTSGNYLLWARVVASNTGNNSFFVSMDDGASVAWHTALGAKNTWIWDQVTDKNDPNPASFYLDAGTHTLVIKQMEDGTRLDSILITTQPGWIPETVYCDAENGGIDGWDVFDAAPSGALITNVFDEDRGSYVIQLAGSRKDNGYRLHSESLSNWANKSQFVIEWSMKYDENFVIYVEVQTTSGYRYLQYEPANADHLGGSSQVRLGLGTGAKDGEWHTFVRDLQADLTKAQEDVQILQVNTFAIRGSGKVDDIKLRQSI